MPRTVLTAIVALIVVSTGISLALNEASDFVLVDNNRAIQLIGAGEPFYTVEQLPDTAPTYFPHPKDLRFDNKQFHFLTQSPDKRYLGFASGDSSRWIGIMNLEERYLKFVAWGYYTQFLDITFSPDSKYMAYTFFGPDKRLKVNIIPMPTIESTTPKVTNTWFLVCREGEIYEPTGWSVPGDTVFSFKVSDAEGQLLHDVDLPLRMDPNSIPEHMQRDMDRKPAGVVDPEDL
jgi:hypothetical protein